MKYLQTKETITLHGLGFLQVKLPGNQRIHVWHPDLPKRSCYHHSNIHDHRFGFTSKVLKGTQVNQYYRVILNHPRSPSHKFYLHEGDRTKHGNRPWIHDFTGSLEPIGITQIINPGESYNVSPYIYHATSCKGICITLMTKTSEHIQGAHSTCRIDVEPDINFDRHMLSETEMWSIFNTALRSVS